MKRGPHSHMLCSTLPIALCYQSLATAEKEERASTGKDCEETRFETEDSKSVELEPSFGIEKLSIHYIFAVGNHRLKTAVNRSAQKFVVEIAIIYLRARTSCGSSSVTRTTETSER